MARRGKNDGKFLRLTGLWPSKKRDGLWSGKLRNQDIENLLKKVKEADSEGADVIFFLWENEKQSKKDPEFTLQCAVAEEQEGYNKSRRSRDDDDDREDRKSRSRRDKDEEDDEEQDEDEEEKPKKSSKKTGKKDNDW